MEDKFSSNPTKTKKIMSKRHKTNPFFSSRKKMEYGGDDANLFIKFFHKHMSLTFGLSLAGFKTLMLVIWQIHNSRIGASKIRIDSQVLDEYTQQSASVDKCYTDPDGVTLNPKNAGLSLATLNRGLKELCDNNILARHSGRGMYHINPYFIYNGDSKTLDKEIARHDPIPDHIASKHNLK
jgi:hypothetical protein